jgi:ABC-2 type transport system permease protein
MNRGSWVALQTISHREIERFLRIWPQTLLPPAITMLLYFLIFGNVIGERIGPLRGFEYASYISPGLIMMSVITNSYASTCFSFYSNKFQRSIEEMLISPVTNHVIIWGYVIGAVARAFATAIIITGISIFFTRLNIYSLTVMLSVVFLSSVIFALAGLINAVYAKSWDGVNIVPAFILVPMTYLGGVFYSIQMLPSFWAHISKYNPILYMVNAYRFGMLGIADVSLWISYVILLSLFAMFYFWIWYLLSRGIGLKQ